MNRKLINIIVFFIIIQGVFAVFNYCEANSSKVVNLSVSSSTGNVGDEVSIDINLNNSLDFASTNLVLKYNTKHLEYVSYTEGEVLKSGAMSIVKNNADTGKIAIGYVANPSNDKIIQSGNILKIVFKLKSDLKTESNLTLECASLKDKEGTDITSTIMNGKIERATSNNDTNNNDTNDNDTNNNDTNNNDTNNNDTSTENKKDEIINKSEAETNFPKAGLSKKTIYIIIFLILISVVFYNKNRSLEEIR